MVKEIHIWRIEARDDFTTPETSLHREELDRMRRFRAPLHGRRWAFFRSGMRLILTRYLDIAPIDIDFCNEEYGKLSVRERPDLYFNLSHSGAQALLSVTSLAPVGVDVEYQRPVLEMDGVIDQCFTPGERADLLALPPEQREAAFYELWTCKEAVMKASGMGLQMSPNSLDIGVSAGTRRLTPDGWQAVTAAGRDRQFRFTRLEPGPGYKGAVALELASSTPFQAPRLRFFDFEPASASGADPSVTARSAAAMEYRHAGYK